MGKIEKKCGSTSEMFPNPRVILHHQQTKKQLRLGPKRGVNQKEFDVQLSFNTMFSENKRHNYTSILDRDLDGNYELGLESIIFPGSYRFLFLKLSIRFFEPVTTNNYDEWKNAR